MSSASALRPLLAGLAGGVGGWLLGQKGAASVPDVTYEEPTPNILATGRAGEILKFGAPKEGVSGPLVYKNHVLAYDSARRVPKWVAEHLSREVADKEQVANRKGVNFGPDPTVPKEFSSDNRDYWGSGWSRGHMAPAGNNKHCQDSMNQTFYYTNVVPQDLDNNGNYWNRLEIWCRNLVKQYQDVWITSGPLWLAVEEPPKEEETTNDQSDKVLDGGDTDVAQAETKKKRKVRPPRPAARRMSYPVIGPNQVSVPTHLYKVIVVSDPTLIGPQLAAFVVPNKPVEDRHLTEFQVDLKKLERESGLTFHPELDRSTVGDLCKENGCNLQNYKEFQQFFWSRRLSSPWNLRNLEKDWAEATRKGVATPALEKVYLESKEKLVLKEKREADPAPVAAAA